MKRTVIGILAHVDAGKTTLAEAMMYVSGGIRSLGRVDHGDAFLDTFTLERRRGITIFSKQAVMDLDGLQATLLDTPGHVDFSAEMERTLNVLDCAILVIGGSACVQSHTRTLWHLLRRKNIPTFLFVSKMDLPGADRSAILHELQQSLDPGVTDLSDYDPEEVALCDEDLLDELLSSGSLSPDGIRDAVARGSVYPVWFGSALKLQGVEEFLGGLRAYAPESPQGEVFSAQVFKIARDAQGVRETHLKVTGGTLSNRQTVGREKVTQLRIYSGAKYRAVETVYPGDVVAVVGLSDTCAGMGIGDSAQADAPVLSPVLTYRLLLPEGADLTKVLEQVRLLEEEDPQLHVAFDALHQEIRVQIMGSVQLEILRDLMLERYGQKVDFSQGSILYRETIADTVEGVGHYEPLRHYAEVHLLLEPGERGSGLILDSSCSENDLDRNWQRLILTHLAEKQHLGVLTGAPITDMRITLVSGRAHLKHTEGGDFRQATYRAVRQGLMQAESVLLEPWYDFRAELPRENVGRAMTDLQRMGASLSPLEAGSERTVLTGSAPVAALRDYPETFTAYTHGEGILSLSFRGYAPCQNQTEIFADAGYDPEADPENSPDSIFCSHGAGHVVKWREVPAHMHLPSVLESPHEESDMEALGRRYRAMAATDKELIAIFERTYGPIRQDRRQAMRTPSADRKPYRGTPVPAGPEYVLVDGYNIIFAWEDLKALACDDLGTARDRLIDILRNYQSFRQCPVILVFDAYKVPGNPGSVERYGDLSVVYTKEAQTADSYIERLSYELGKKHRVRVATSDAMEQIIILGHGCLRVSARMFEAEVNSVMETIRSFLVQ